MNAIFPVTSLSTVILQETIDAVLARWYSDPV